MTAEIPLPFTNHPLTEATTIPGTSSSFPEASFVFGHVVREVTSQVARRISRPESCRLRWLIVSPKIFFVAYQKLKSCRPK